MNREEIIQNINEITVACQKKNSNVKEGIQKASNYLGFSEETVDKVFEDLTPFVSEKTSWIVELGTQIVDSEGKQTANNISNFYTMINRDETLLLQLDLWEIKPLNPNISQLLGLFGL